MRILGQFKETSKLEVYSLDSLRVAVQEQINILEDRMKKKLVMLSLAMVSKLCTRILVPTWDIWVLASFLTIMTQLFIRLSMMQTICVLRCTTKTEETSAYTFVLWMLNSTFLW